MGTGFLEVVTTAAIGALPIPNVRITVSQNGNILYEIQTNESGISAALPLEAPAVALTLDPDFTSVPYSLYDVVAKAQGFTTTTIRGVEILDTETSILPINMVPYMTDGQSIEMDVGQHNLTSKEDRHMERPGPFAPRVLSEVIIPEYITVHLGRPDRVARNVRVPFPYYIKNVCSHEIYSTWPAASLEANIYCQISLTLNRIFTEWYRVRGHNFDITNSTQFDQMFVEGGQIFRSIDEMVDRIINRFIRREGHVEPFFAEYCDGRRVTCPGLWQWSTVTLANQGRNALQILRHFYPNDVQIVETDNIGWVRESWPGYALRPGMSGDAVRSVQNWLNRIRVNFPIIPLINPVTGVYGPQTEAAVRAFQSIRDLGMLTPTGIVDRATWLSISRTLSAVMRLGELTSEGLIQGIGRTPPTDIIREGARGRLVAQAQYIMNFIAQFYPAVPMVTQNSSFTRDFTTAVREFQRAFGLNPDGIIGPNTWRELYRVYWRIRDNVNIPDGGNVAPPLPPPIPPPQPPTPPPPPGGIPPYPGALIRVGSRGADVERIQRCLNNLRAQHPSIGQLNVDGVFGPITQASVMAFQRVAGLNPDGIVGPLTWNALMPLCYGRPMPPYPGYLMRIGVRGDNVQQVQSCLNGVQNAGLATDGVFGPLTDAAVRTFQRNNGLNADGIVGPLTWDALMRRCGFTPTAVRRAAVDAIAPAEPMPEPTMDEILPSEREIVSESIDDSSILDESENLNPPPVHIGETHVVPPLDEADASEAPFPAPDVLVNPSLFDAPVVEVFAHDVPPHAELLPEARPLHNDDPRREEPRERRRPEPLEEPQPGFDFLGDDDDFDQLLKLYLIRRMRRP